MLSDQATPFFADHGDLSRSETTTNTTDAGGNLGFAYSMYSVTEAGKRNPFIIYIVEEYG